MNLPHGRLLKFLASGVPGMGCALALNYLLVRSAGVPKLIAYGPVLLAQMWINYSLCRFFVFGDEAARHPFWTHFLRFLAGSLVLRLLDWALYGLLTAQGVPFLLAQILNVALFALLRFRYVQSLFTLPQPGPAVAPAPLSTAAAGAALPRSAHARETNGTPAKTSD